MDPYEDNVRRPDEVRRERVFSMHNENAYMQNREEMDTETELAMALSIASFEEERLQQQVFEMQKMQIQELLRKEEEEQRLQREMRNQILREYRQKIESIIRTIEISLRKLIFDSTISFAKPILSLFEKYKNQEKLDFYVNEEEYELLLEGLYYMQNPIKIRHPISEEDFQMILKHFQCRMNIVETDMNIEEYTYED